MSEYAVMLLVPYLLFALPGAGLTHTLYFLGRPGLSEDAKLVACVLCGLVWPLMLTALVLFALAHVPRGVCLASAVMYRGSRDLVRACRPVKLPKARVVK